METNKTAFVTGVTGKQGGAVARHLLNKGYEVIGLTRNVNSENANQLKQAGATLVAGSLEDSSSYKEVLDKADSIFLVQALQKKQQEIDQGKAFINSINTEIKPHLVYASVLGADLNTGVPHFDSKYEIEKHLKTTELPYTVLRPASFYENHLMPQVVKGIRKGNYTSPLNKNCQQQMIGVDDIGKIAAKVISSRDAYSGKTLSIATDQYEIGQIPQVFSEVMNKPVKYGKLPGIITRIFMGSDLSKMFKYMNKNNFSVVKDINAVRKEFDIQGDFNSWVGQHFGNGNS